MRWYRCLLAGTSFAPRRELVADGRAGGRAREALCSCLCLRDSNGAEHTVHSTTASYPPEHQVHRALVVIPALATIAILENRFRIAGLATRAEYYGSGISHVAAPHKGAIRTASLRLAATFAIQPPSGITAAPGKYSEIIFEHRYNANAPPRTIFRCARRTLHSSSAIMRPLS